MLRGLKGSDRAAALLLAQLRRERALDGHLVIVTKHQHGQAEEQEEDYNHRKYHGAVESGVIPAGCIPMFARLTSALGSAWLQLRLRL